MILTDDPSSSSIVLCWHVKDSLSSHVAPRGGRLRACTPGPGSVRSRPRRLLDVHSHGLTAARTRRTDDWPTRLDSTRRRRKPTSQRARRDETRRAREGRRTKHTTRPDTTRQVGGRRKGCASCWCALVRVRASAPVVRVVLHERSISPSPQLGWQLRWYVRRPLSLAKPRATVRCAWTCACGAARSRSPQPHQTLTERPSSPSSFLISVQPPHALPAARNHTPRTARLRSSSPPTLCGLCSTSLVHSDCDSAPPVALSPPLHPAP